MIIENNPRGKYKTIAVIFLVAAVLGWLIYQQITINSLRKVLMPTSGNPATGEMSTAPSGVSLSARAEDVKKTLMENERSIRGSVKSISGNNLTVEADIIDFSKFGGMKDEDLQKPVDSLPTQKKTYSVLVNDKTEFSSKKLVDIKQGDSIQVDTNEAVYAANTLTAIKVTDPISFGETSSSLKSVGGKVSKVENNVITLVATPSSGQEAAVYSVKIVQGTKLVKQDLSANPPKTAAMQPGDIKPGDNAVALAADPIGNRKEFEATQLILLILPPKK